MGGELADQVGEVTVVGVAAGFGAANGDDLVGDVIPMIVEVLAAGGLWRRRAGRVGEVEPVGAFAFLELQCPREIVEHTIADAVGVPAFEAGVVVDADCGERRDLLPARTQGRGGCRRRPGALPDPG